MTERAQPNRWRCLATGCNPKLNEATAAEHKDATGHRVAKWPVRSAAGKAKARQRNRSGYYDKYNVGDKAYGERFGTFGEGDRAGSFTLGPEDMSVDEMSDNDWGVSR